MFCCGLPRQGSGAGSFLKGISTVRSVSLGSRGCGLGEAGLSWTKKELIPIYGLNSEYIFGFKDAVIQWQKGWSVGRLALSGHLRMGLSSKTTVSRSSFERNVINLVFASKPLSTPGISFHQIFRGIQNIFTE